MYSKWGSEASRLAVPWAVHGMDDERAPCQGAAAIRVVGRGNGLPGKVGGAEHTSKVPSEYRILHGLPTGICIVDRHGTVTLFNRAAENLTGLTSDRVVGKRFDTEVAPRIFDCGDVSSARLGNLTGPVSLEPNSAFAGSHGCRLEVTVSPIEEFPGGSGGFVLSFKDAGGTERMLAQSTRNGRLAAMGEMAAKVAHEIRNPLGGLELFSSMLKESLKESEELAPVVEHMSSAVRSISSIVSNLLLFVRPNQKPDFSTIDIHEPVKEAIFFSNPLRSVHDPMTVETRFSGDELLIRGDRELLKQAFLNITLNAVQAMPGGGTLTVSTRQKRDGMGAGRSVEVRIRDTGAGIDDGVKDRIFDPFFTTKTKGTGLGLAITHTIIGLHNGTVDIVSGRPRGTECVVTIPLR